MKRVLAVLASLALVLALPSVASAGRVTRFTDHNVGIFCDGMAATSGGGFVFFSAAVSDEFGPDAGIDFFAEGNTTGTPDLFRDFDQPGRRHLERERARGIHPAPEWQRRPGRCGHVLRDPCAVG